MQINETTCRSRRQERGEWGEVGIFLWNSLIPSCIFLYISIEWNYSIPFWFLYWYFCIFELNETTFDSFVQEDSDCWSETPEYFRQVAWPGYVSNREGLRYVFQKEKLGIPQPTFRNVPGVIYLDSTINTVDEQLVEVLKRVLSHLQVA